MLLEAGGILSQDCVFPLKPHELLPVLPCITQSRGFKTLTLAPFYSVVPMSLTGLPLLRVIGLQLTTGSGRKRPKLMDFPRKSQRPPPRVWRRYLLPVLERGPKKCLNLSRLRDAKLSSRSSNIAEKQDGNEYHCSQEEGHKLTKLLLEQQGNDRTSTIVTATEST